MRLRPDNIELKHKKQDIWLSVESLYAVVNARLAVIRVAKTHLAICGDHIAGVPPVLIPNTEVKPCRADGTCLDTDRESRTSPHFLFLGSSVGRAPDC